MRKLLWIGDAAVSSGFARCTHKTLDVLKDEWDVFVLGLNYQGDPHKYPYPIFPCWPGGDAFGLGRVKSLVETIRPDLVVVQNDPWNINEYRKRIGAIPTVASMPVDGMNVRGAALNGLTLAVFWTEFARFEAQKGGYTGPSEVIPLGIDLEMYAPRDRRTSRQDLGLPESMLDAFIVGNVNRNQPRKRLDLTISFFAEWVKTYGIEDAYLFLHVAPTGDIGYDCKQLMAYYGLQKKLILSIPNVGHGVLESSLVDAYSAFDVQVSTTQGEGWGLTTLEGMACGIPQIVPDWSALGEWARGAAMLIPCNEINVTPQPSSNMIGGIPSRKDFINTLHELYCYPNLREDAARKVRLHAENERFSWRRIGERWSEVLMDIVAPTSVSFAGPSVALLGGAGPEKV